MADKIQDFEVNSPRWLSMENFEGEVWKDIPKYEGLYSVSNYGRIKSHDNYLPVKNRWGTTTTRKKRGTIIKAIDNHHGYVEVGLHKNGENNICRIHRIVASVFIPNPYNKPEIDHINTIKTDNRVVNLRWVTKSENMLNPISNARQKIVQGEPVVILDCWGNYISEFISAKEAARYVGISDTVAFEAIKRNRGAVSLKGFIIVLRKYYDPSKDYKLSYKYKSSPYNFVPNDKIVVAFKDNNIKDVFCSTTEAAKFYNCHPSNVKWRIHRCNIGGCSEIKKKRVKINDDLYYISNLSIKEKEAALELFKKKYKAPAFSKPTT